MKKRIFNTGLIGVVLLSVTLSVWALPPDRVIKKYHKSYPATHKTVLSIQNKYGDVNLENWEKDSISIDVKIMVEYPDREKAQKLLGYLKVDFNIQGDNISAVTVIDNDFSRYGRHFWGNEKKFSIDYTIHTPAYINYNLLNKYGNAFINKIDGKINIEIRYGHLKINKLTQGNHKPLNNIILAYSKGTIEEANWLMLNLKYSRLEINHVSALAGETRYSKLYTGDVSSIVLESKYDTYRFGKLNNLFVEAGYGDIEADEVRKKVMLETRFTDVSVKNIPAGFTSIEVDNEYGHIKLDIDSVASYRLTGSTSYCAIHYPESDRISRITKNNSSEVHGFIGKDRNSVSTVKIKSRYGTVDLH